jgi:hypothetical protein
LLILPVPAYNARTPPFFCLNRDVFVSDCHARLFTPASIFCLMFDTLTCSCLSSFSDYINPLNADLNPICHFLVLSGDLTFMGPCIVSIFQYISNKMHRYTVYVWKLLCMFRVVFSPIIRSAYNCIYSICYLSHRYCYLPLSPTAHSNRFQLIAADSSNGVTNTRCCRYSCMRF